MAWGVVDDEAIEEARSVIGVSLRRDNWAWVEQASRDTISHYAEGMGDGNPISTESGVDGDGQRVGRATTQMARTPRKDELDKATGGKRKYAQRPTHRYTQDELLAIEKEALSEPVRGAETRYWEDVQVGDEIDQV